MQYKQHICGSFSSLNNMYGSGGNSSFVIQELIMQHFFVFFQKVNLQNFTVTMNKINSSSDLLISYPSIIQTQIKHLLPTSFKFRVNPYIKTILSKTRKNSRLKTRYLKGIMIEHYSCDRTILFIRAQVQWQPTSGRTIILEPI